MKENFNLSDLSVRCSGQTGARMKKYISSKLGFTSCQPKNQNFSKKFGPYLTPADDGPSPLYTERLLDGLKERGVVATFFVTGENAESCPDLIRREKADGHLIGNHTYSHIQLTSDNKEVFREELVKTNEILKAITGENVTYIRPPYGSWDKSLEQDLNMFPVLWNVDPLDWCTPDAGLVMSRVLQQVEDGDIILLHDYYDTSVTAALMIVDEMKKQGYEFVTVEEILFD